jgi:hypothetical protein
MIFCIWQKIQRDTLFKNFKNYPIEQTKVYKDFGASCGNETTIAKGVTADLRSIAAKALLKMIMQLQ